MNGTAISDPAYSGWITHVPAVVESSYTRNVISDATTTFSTTSADSALDGWYDVCHTMIDASDSSVLEVTCIVVRVYWDACTSDF